MTAADTTTQRQFPADETAPDIGDHSRPFGGDVLWVLVAALLVLTSTVTGYLLTRSGSQLFVNAAPLQGEFVPHVGVGTPAAIGLAVLALVYAPRLARRLPWRALMISGWVLAIAWTISLALIDGWRGGIAARLEDRNEYLHDLPRIGSVSSFLSTFTDHILDFQPDSWTTHVSSHPPGATLVFLALDRLGLGGGTWAALLVILVGTLAAVAVPMTVRALVGPAAARSIWPFVVFFPGAVWVGVSADGLFLGVSAVGIALATLGATGRRRLVSPLLSLAGGLLLGITVYLSYGLAALVLVVVAIAGLTLRTARIRDQVRIWSTRWGLSTAGVLVVAAVFTVSGFYWWEGLALLHTRYYQGIALLRPYGYFIWANFAALSLSAGPAMAPSIARAVTSVVRRAPGSGWSARWSAPTLLTFAALTAILIADVTGLSKAETERIWLSFGIWLLCSLSLVPARQARWLLAGQLATALVVNHLVSTTW